VDCINLRNDDFNTLPSVVTVRGEETVLPTDKIAFLFTDCDHRLIFYK